MFLLSYDDVQNPSLGFESGTEASETRVAYTSQYVNTDEPAERYWLRGSGVWFYGSLKERFVNADGSTGSWFGTYSYGVRPVIRVKKDATNLSYTKPVIKNPTDTNSDNANNKSTTELIIGENVSGNMDDESAKFFPEAWELSTTTLPVTLSKEVNPKDSSYTLKIAIGIGKSNILDNEAEWDKYKQVVKDAQKNTDILNKMSEIRDAYDVKTITNLKVKFDEKPKVNIMGYYEEKYDKNNYLISKTGRIAISGRWGGGGTKYFLTSFGPLYINLRAEGKITGKFGAVYTPSENTLKPTGKLTPKLSVSLEGGYGIHKVCTISAAGKANFTLDQIAPTKLTFNANAGIHLYTAFFVDYTYTLAQTSEITIWDTSPKKKKSAFWQPSSPPEGVSLLDTSFSSHTTAWNGEAKQPVSFSKRSNKTDYTANGISKTVLQNGVLTNTLPMIKEINGKQVMIFQSYDSSKDTLNSSVLKYSVLENGIWSEPKPIWNTGTSDLYADMQVVGDKLVVVWQKVKDTITGNVETDAENVLSEIAKNSEICYAEFDTTTNSFTNTSYITQNNNLEMMPKICTNTDTVTISYVSNTVNDMMQISGNNIIYTTTKNEEGFSSASRLASFDSSIENYIIYAKDDKIHAGISSVTDSQKAVLYDETGAVISNISESDASSISVSSVQYGDNNIYYCVDGILYAYNINTKRTMSYTAGENAFGSNATYYNNGNKKAFLWSEYDKETNTTRLYTSIYNKNEYSSPIMIYEEKGSIFQYCSAILDDKGSWNIVTNVYNTSNKLNALVYLTGEAKENIKLIAASVNENDIKDGLTGINYYVTNTSENTLNEIQMKVTLEDGTKIDKNIKISLAAGDSAYGTVYVDLRKVKNAQNATLCFNASNHEDEANTISATIGMDDISVENTIQENGTKINTTATVTNNSSHATDTVVYLYSDEKESKELYSSETIHLDAGEKKEISVVLSQNSITYNPNDAAYLKWKAVTANGDYKEENNESYAILYGKNAIKAVYKKGEQIKDSKTKAIYRITGKSNGTYTAAYIGTANKKLTKVIIPEKITYKGTTFKITSIAANALKSNKIITSLTIGKNIKSIGKNAFLNCSKLKNITIKTTLLKNNKVGKNVWKGIVVTATVKVPKKQKKLYTKILKKRGLSKKSKIIC